MRKRHVLIAVLIAVLLFPFLRMLQSDSPESADPSIRLVEVLRQEPPKQSGGVQPRVSVITASPFRDPGGMRYSVRDRGTQKPVAGATLLGPDGAALGVTEQDGVLKFKEGENVTVTGVIVSLLSGEEKIALNAPDVVVVSATERTLLVDFYARVQLQISGPPLPLKAVRGRIIEHTVVSDKDGLSEREVEKLQLASCDIDAYANALRRKPGARSLNFEFTKSMPVDGAMEELRVRWRGRCAVELELDGWTTTTAFVDLVPGQAHNLSMEFHQPPTVSGILLDEHGRPIADAPVQVAYHAEFGKDDVLPRVATSGPTEWRGLVRNSLTKVITVYSGARGVTEADGTWSIKVGLADAIAAYAYIEGRDRAYVTHSGARFESVSGIVLRAPRSKNAATMLVVDDETGTGLGGATLTLAQSKPIDPYQIDIAALHCDVGGRVSIAWLDPNLEYRGIIRKSGASDPLEVDEFTPKPGGVLRIRKRLKD